MTSQHTVATILIVGLLTIAGAWAFQFAGYAPCPLCLQQRWAWYAAIVLSAALMFLPAWQRPGLALLALIMLGSAIFGAWHAGIEWKFWPGPGTCAGTLSTDLPVLGDDPVVGCDDAAIRIFGISLAGYNALISLALAILAAYALRKRSS